MISKLLRSKLEQLGAIVRRVEYIQRKGCPDFAVFYKSHTFWVETKAKNGRLSTHQSQEIKNLALAGVTVHVVNSRVQIFELLKIMRDL
jgi:hypothetical protein